MLSVNTVILPSYANTVFHMTEKGPDMLPVA